MNVTLQLKCTHGNMSIVYIILTNSLNIAFSEFECLIIIKYSDLVSRAYF